MVSLEEIYEALLEEKEGETPSKAEDINTIIKTYGLKEINHALSLAFLEHNYTGDEEIAFWYILGTTLMLLYKDESRYVGEYMVGLMGSIEKHINIISDEDYDRVSEDEELLHRISEAMQYTLPKYITIIIGCDSRDITLDELNSYKSKKKK